jgi:hypothetical protein
MARTSMVKIIDNEPERVILVSWRPSAGDEKMNKWVRRLKQRLRLECGPVTIVDPLEPARDKASEREPECTDFVSLLTVDYATACGEEDDHELLKYLPALRDGVSPVCFWAVRLDAGKQQRWRVGNKREAAWEAGSRWHFLPSTEDHFSIYAEDIDTKMAQQCIDPLNEHEPDCMVCRADTHGTQD